jgi:hypothetical protein
MEEEHDRGIGWAGFAVEDGYAVGLDAVDGSKGNIRFLGHRHFLFPGEHGERLGIGCGDCARERDKTASREEISTIHKF